MTLRSAVIRYVAYAVMIVLVGAALLGFLERDGRARADEPAGTVEIDYPKVTRQGLKPALAVEVVNRDRVAREVSIDLSSEYLEALQLGTVSPDPAESRGVGDGQVRYTFAAIGTGERLRALFAFSIDQQSPRLRARTPVRVALGEAALLETSLTTTVLP